MILLGVMCGSVSWLRARYLANTPGSLCSQPRNSLVHNSCETAHLYTSLFVQYFLFDII